MGMRLKPIAPFPSAPRDECGVVWGRYNWAGWCWLIEHLKQWGVDTSEFAGTNDGAKISALTCKAVANAIEAHLYELSEEDQRRIEPDIVLWRTCGGYRQY